VCTRGYRRQKNVVLKEKGIKAKMELNEELKKEFQGTKNLIKSFKEQGI